jgi:hypothetical protein
MLHNPLINNEFQVSGKDAPVQFESNVLNLIGHYRYWAIKHHFTVKVFAFYSTTLKSFKNNIYIPNYRDHFKQINARENSSYFFVNNTIQIGWSLLPVITKYIPDVYMIDSRYIEPSVIPLYIAENISKMDWNLLVSRDPYDLQYAYKNKWSLLSPKGDQSMVINQEGIWNYVNFKERVFKDTKDLHYPYDLYIYAKAAVGDRYRSIPRLRKIGWKTLFKFLDEVMEKNPDAIDSTLIVKLVEKIKGKSILSDEEINDNLQCINIDLQMKEMMEIDKAFINNQIIDVPDYESLQKLNQNHYIKYPINLQFLCNTSKINERKSPFD